MRPVARAGLALVAAAQAQIGIWALTGPHSFFLTFPGFGLPPVVTRMVRHYEAGWKDAPLRSSRSIPWGKVRNYWPVGVVVTDKDERDAIHYARLGPDDSVATPPYVLRRLPSC